MLMCSGIFDAFGEVVRSRYSQPRVASSTMSDLQPGRYFLLESACLGVNYFIMLEELLIEYIMDPFPRG